MDITDLKQYKLVYVTDQEPGITRQTHKGVFIYLNPNAERVSDEETLVRIQGLVLPPAWEGVWICALHNGHLQATGRDSKLRKQYRYHQTWSELSKSNNYAKLLDFAAVLPRIRQRIDADLQLADLPKQKVLAAIVKLLDETFIRIGNEEYAKENKTYGLTTMLNRHANIEGTQIKFKFVGKSHQKHEITLRDRRLANIIKKCQDLPGQTLFQYVDAAEQRHPITSQDVNDYLFEITSQDITAKDFRTWGGTVNAVNFLNSLPKPTDETSTKQNLVEVVKETAAILGNKPAVCRAHYIHNGVLQTYLDGNFFELTTTSGGKRIMQQDDFKNYEISTLRLLNNLTQ